MDQQQNTIKLGSPDTQRKSTGKPWGGCPVVLPIKSLAELKGSLSWDFQVQEQIAPYRENIIKVGAYRCTAEITWGS